jgi:vacuolar-type H+-ATPase subunit C/Vma6
MELALDQWRFREAHASLVRFGQSAESLSLALDIEADLVNLITALRFAHAPAERQVLYKRLGKEGISRLFVDPGQLSLELLEQAGQQDTVENAVEILGGTHYEIPLRQGLENYAQSGRLSDFEKQLRRFYLRQMAQLIIKDPLGIGVPLGFFALKISEVTNIRWIARGIGMGLKADAIKAELEFVA